MGKLPLKLHALEIVAVWGNNKNIEPPIFSFIDPVVSKYLYIILALLLLCTGTAVIITVL